LFDGDELVIWVGIECGYNIHNIDSFGKLLVVLGKRIGVILLGDINKLVGHDGKGD
jgi:hypothetical protein